MVHSRRAEFGDSFCLVSRSRIGWAFAAMDFRFRRGARCSRTGTRAYPSAVCEERTTKSEPKRHAALRVAPQLASGFVAPQSQPHFGGCSFVAPRQKPTAAQQMPNQFVNGTLALVGTPTGREIPAPSSPAPVPQASPKLSNA